MLNLQINITENKITHYNLSPQFTNNNYIYQRTIEGCWPSRYEKNSKYKLVPTAELKSNSPWKVISKKRNVSLVISN